MHLLMTLLLACGGKTEIEAPPPAAEATAEAPAEAAPAESTCDVAKSDSWSACDGQTVTLEGKVADNVMNHPMTGPVGMPGEEGATEPVTSYVDVGDVQIVVTSPQDPGCRGAVSMTGVLALVDLGGAEGTPDSYRGLRLDATEVSCE